MKVKDIMTGEPRTCSLDTTLAAAAALMLDGDCGILPMVTDGKLFGSSPIATSCSHQARDRRCATPKW